MSRRGWRGDAFGGFAHTSGNVIDRSAFPSTRCLGRVARRALTRRETHRRLRSVGGDGRDGACGCGESEIAKHANDDADIFVIAVMRASASLAPYSLDAVLMAGTVPVCFN